MQDSSKRPPEKSRVPELLAFFCDVLADRLRRAGNDAEKANGIALDVTDVMRKQFGGQSIYFPKGMLTDADEKAEETYAAFMSGKTIHELAHEFNCSTVWVYRRIERVRAKRRTEGQVTKT